MVDPRCNAMPFAGLRQWLFLLLTFECCFAVVSDFAFGADTESKTTTVVSGDYSIGQQGRLILLPVTVDGRVHSFLLDTGACRTGMDLSLKHSFGDYAGTVILQSSAGKKLVKTYEWPEATLDGQAILSDRPIAAIDFADLRQATGLDIMGVLGMDILGKNRIQIDFDGGHLHFLKALPTDRSHLGVPVPIEVGENGAPFLRGQLADDINEPFLIDTGAHGNAIRSKLFDQLVQRQLLQIGTNSFTSQTVAGQIQGLRGRLPLLSFGPISHRELRFARVEISAIGLRFLSRYVVTFDFPERTAYFQKGLDHDKPEPQATSGMTILWIDHRVIIKGVKDRSPAMRAGIQIDDEIVQVNGSAITGHDHHTLRQLLTSNGGRNVGLQILREGQPRNINMTLDDDF